MTIFFNTDLETIGQVSAKIATHIYISIYIYNSYLNHGMYISCVKLNFDIVFFLKVCNILWDASSSLVFLSGFNLGQFQSILFI